MKTRKYKKKSVYRKMKEQIASAQERIEALEELAGWMKAIIDALAKVKE